MTENENAPAATRRREHGLEADTCRFGKGEQGQARPAISALRGGPHLDLGRLRLKPWCLTFFIAETTWPTYLYMRLSLNPTHGTTLFRRGYLLLFWSRLVHASLGMHATLVALGAVMSPIRSGPCFPRSMS